MSRKHIYVLIFLAAVVWPIASRATDTSGVTDYGPLLDLKFLKGVDTIAVSDNFGPGTVMLLDINHVSLMPIVLEALSASFSSKDNQVGGPHPVSIKPLNSMDYKESKKPNVLVVTFILSARQEVVDGKVLRVASLELQFKRKDQDGADLFDVEAATYPFIAPNNVEELKGRVHDGVYFLTSFLPSHWICSNKSGRPTKQCPDCSFDHCKFDKPYGDIE